MSELGAAKIDTVIWHRAPVPNDLFDEKILVIQPDDLWPHMMLGRIGKQFPSDRPAFLPDCSDEEMPVGMIEWWARAPKGPVYLQEGNR